MQLVSMEIDLPACLLSRLEDSPGEVRLKHSLLTEDVDVVDGERARAAEILESRDLDTNDVLGSHFSSASSEIDGKYYLLKL